MDISLILKAIVDGKDYIELGIFLLGIVGLPIGSARGAIATVNEVMQGGVEMTDALALQRASEIMGKWLPFLPDFVRKWIIQQAFDSMKKKAKELKNKL
jgi:hypothetical protein